MAITVAARTEIITLVVGMFSAAPGAAVLSDLVAAKEAGATLKQIAASIANTTEFKSIYPTFLTNAEFATKLVDNLVGSLVPAADKAAAATQVEAMLTAGTSRSNVVVDVIAALDAAPSTHPVFGNAAAALDNKVAVATHYSIEKQRSGSSLDDLQNVIKDVTNTDASVTAAKLAVENVISVGKTFVLQVNVIDNLVGTSGNDIFLGDNNSASAGDTINGGAGNDMLRLFNTVNLGNLTSVETVEINGSNTGFSTATNADITAVSLINTELLAIETITLSATQSLALKNVDDTANNNFALTIGGAAATRNVSLEGVGNAATGGTDVLLTLDSGATGTDLNLSSSTTASRVTLNNGTSTIRTLNLSGDASTTFEAASSVGTTVRTLAITNTGTTTMTVSTAGTATTGLAITGAGGKEVITLGKAAGANALNDKVSVDLGASDDTLAITLLTAATNINAAAKFAGGDGADVLAVAAGGVIDATTGKQFAGFETLAVTAGTYDLAFLASSNTVGTLSVAAALTAAVTVNNLAEAASVVIGADTAAFAMTINQKDAGAGSPDDVITVTLAGSAVTGAGRTANSVDVNDIETVNLTGTGGTATTTAANVFTALIANETTKITASTTANSTLEITNLDASALVLFDASAALNSVKVTTNDAFVANAGVAFKGGAGADTIVLTGASTASAGIDFLITGNGGADAITLVAGQVDHLVYLAAADSTATKFDSITTFATTADKIDLKAFGFTGAADDAVVTVGAGVSVNGVSGAVEVTSAAAGNFFNDTGLDRGVAEAVVGADLFVFVDVNKDGDYSSADLVIKLVGLNAGGFAVGDVVYA